MTPRPKADAPALSPPPVWQQRKARLSFPVPCVLLTARHLFQARAPVLQVMLLQTGRLQRPDSHSPQCWTHWCSWPYPACAPNCPLLGLGVPPAGLARGRGPSLSFICAAETPRSYTKTICSPIFSRTLCRETQYFGGAAEILLVLI